MSKDIKWIYANSPSISHAEIIVLGVAVQSKSSIKRHGTEYAPKRIRQVSCDRQVVYRHSKASYVLPGDNKLSHNICDIGDIKRENLTNKIKEIVECSKIPIIIGGNHSATLDILKGIMTGRLSWRNTTEYLNNFNKVIVSYLI